ncbi:hypothetical protein [Priestia koreensis]|uniref:hypothetical protein n=1 Tax=Priestia koreensis TaxID=284581 RepID=UPI00203EA804|nr:hypothetical protein [Priestia koreensis]MCM3004616.1 hypothetical protein [Priestia koreensis]
MKKKVLWGGVILLLSAFTFSAGVLAAPKLSLYFNNKQQKTEIKMINNKPYVGLSDVTALFGGKVAYDKKTNSYRVTSKDYKAPTSTTTKSFAVKAVGTSGPMKLAISKVTLAPSYKYDSYMPTIKAVVLEVTVSNLSKNKVSWYPDQGTFAFNTGEQVDDAILYGNKSVGGDFLGGTTKKGQIVLKVGSNLDLLKSFQVSINGAHDENFEPVGNDIMMNVKFR